MIQCRDVSVCYKKGTPVFSPLSFSAEAGEITVLLGKNGCGKSTLLRALCASISYSGSILLDGAECSALSPRLRARRIACMPQLLRAPEMTVRELVLCGRQPYTDFTGVPSAADRSFADEILQKTGLSSLQNKLLTQISGGERQKAYFAMLLAQDTQNLLLDEPASHLDAAYTSALTSFLSDARRAGKTIVCVLHDLNRALELADHLLLLHDGMLRFDGTPAAFADSKAAEEVFSLRRFRAIAENGDTERYFYY